MQAESDDLRKISLWSSVALLLAGLLFYVIWSLIYDTWDLSKVENMGVYSVSIVLCGFGIVGILLYSRRIA
ncbi:MAG: hypothetical protein AB1665_05930 [Candidatus Thermoplasmatota archaeon]